MVSVLDSGLSCLGSSTGKGHLCCVLAFTKTLYNFTVPLSNHVYKWELANLVLVVTL